MITYELPLPYKYQANKRKSNSLMTVNVQRNLHYAAAANFKKKYGSVCASAIPLAKKQLLAVKLTYVLNIIPTKGNPTKALPFRGSKPKVIDLTNILSVVDKVNSDELVNAGHILDDTISNVESVEFRSSNWSDRNYISVSVEEILPQIDPRI